MSELNTPQSTPADMQANPKLSARINKQMGEVGIKVMAGINRVVPTYNSADAMALAVARFTPRALVICCVIFFASILGSFLNIWAENFLWGIPALGAVSVCLAFWIWSSNLVLRPDLPAETREVLRRAVKLQMSMLVLSVLVIAYFVGLALGAW